MPSKDSQTRRVIAGIGLLLATAVIATAGRLMTPPFEPGVPAYREKGTPGAPIVITEFSDFQCPACQQVVGPLHQVLTLYPGKISLRFRHMPWDFHRWAAAGAAAAECAGKQGKFWEYHDLLFARQGAWSLAATPEANLSDFLRYAKETGLDETAFGSCLKDPETAKAIEKERKENRDAWINSTPTMVINGKRFIGSHQLRTVGLNHIENELKKAGRF